MYVNPPYFREAFGTNIGMFAIIAICTVAMRFWIQSDNKRLARLEDVSVPLSDKDYQVLKRTAEVEKIDIATARELQKGFRYLL